MARKIRKDDEVIVLHGARQGQAWRRAPESSPRPTACSSRASTWTKRHVKPTQAEPQGGIVEREAPIHISNVALIDPESDRPTRVGYKTLEDGRKVRVAARSGEVIDV